jgi:hypothetical protein
MRFIAIKQWCNRSVDELAREILHGVQTHASARAVRSDIHGLVVLGEEPNEACVQVAMFNDHLSVSVKRAAPADYVMLQRIHFVICASIECFAVMLVPKAAFDYEPTDVPDFLRCVDTAAAAVPGLLGDGEQLFEFSLYTFK